MAVIEHLFNIVYLRGHYFTNFMKFFQKWNQFENF